MQPGLEEQEPGVVGLVVVVRRSTPTIASGNSRPVSTTRNSEMPSMPRCHEMPELAIQAWFDLELEAGVARLEARPAAQMVSAPVATAKSDADEAAQLGPAPGHQAPTTSAPTRRQRAMMRGQEREDASIR